MPSNVTPGGGEHIAVASYATAVLAGTWENVLIWWNGVELWLTQLWFPVQLALLMAVLLPLCWSVALLIDRTVDSISDWVRRRTGVRDTEEAR